MDVENVMTLSESRVISKKPVPSADRFSISSARNYFSIQTISSQPCLYGRWRRLDSRTSSSPRITVIFPVPLRG